MKTIKFRSAFYKHTGGFSHFSYWGFINTQGEYDPTCFASPSQNSMSYRKTEEQFTGLLDKNGKEIYDGDVVEYHMVNRHERGEVKFGHYELHEFLPCWVANNKDIGIGLFVKSKDSNEVSAEVIGNIHENPELTK